MPQKCLNIFLYVCYLAFSRHVSDTVIENGLFSDFKNQHNDICLNDKEICDNHPDYSSKCCGYCKCDPDCKRHGSCCLNEYKTFEEASFETTNTRYDCVRAQYLSGPDTKYNDLHDNYRWSTYWMVTKCHPNYTDMPIIELCTSPGLHGSVESVVPVTLISTNEHFRNKYCALCNKHALNDIILDWELDIYADSFIRFPDQNFLNRIKSNRENIFFTPPIFVKHVDRCAMPSYTIRKCNESGLWGQYNEDIELACNSFTDPYNHTYKNMFCYMCNSGLNFTKINYKFAHCGEQPVYNGRKRPEFTAVVSIDTVMGYNSEEQFSCGTKQFHDRKLKVCRDALCYSGFSHIDGSCQNEEVCYEVYVTMSVITELRPSVVDTIQNDQYIDDLLDRLNIHIPHFEENVLQMKVFYHADGFNLVDYFLLYLIVDGAYEQVRGEDEKELFLHNKTIRKFQPSGLFDDEIHDYILRIESYNITVLEETASLYVPSLSEANNSDLLHVVKFTNTSSCTRQQVVPFNKVRICSYFEISLTKFAFSVSTGHLIFAENSSNPKPILKLLPWEYMIKEDHVLICITDFFRLYSLLPVQVSKGASLVLKRDECCCWMYIILTFCLYKGLAPFSF